MRRSAANGASLSSIDWFWQTRQRKFLVIEFVLSWASLAYAILNQEIIKTKKKKESLKDNNTDDNEINKDNKKLNISFVTKKKLGNAVKRNKIKRRLRNILNEAVKKISINFNYSFLVIAKSSMLNNEYKLIKETLFQDFEKIK